MNQRPRVHPFHQVFGWVSLFVYMLCLAHQKPFRESYNFILKRRELNSFVLKLSPPVLQCDEKQPNVGGSPSVRDDFSGEEKSQKFHFGKGNICGFFKIILFVKSLLLCWALERVFSHLLSPSC